MAVVYAPLPVRKISITSINAFAFVAIFVRFAYDIAAAAVVGITVGIDRLISTIHRFGVKHPPDFLALSGAAFFAAFAVETASTTIG